MFRQRPTIALVCFGVVVGVPMLRADTCGFVAPRATSGWNDQRIGLRMASSNKPDDWRAALDELDSASRSEPGGGMAQDGGGPREGQPRDMGASTRALEEATRVAESSLRRPSIRKPDPPPEIANLQTKSQRRRNLPLSQLKRLKPKRVRVDEEEGEFRSLVPKTDRESVLRGEDYWIDYRELDKKTAQREARSKAPAPDQFAQSKMRAEIVNPYKQNWILAISIAIVAVAGFIKLNPGILDETIITFPGEL